MRTTKFNPDKDKYPVFVYPLHYGVTFKFKGGKLVNSKGSPFKNRYLQSKTYGMRDGMTGVIVSYSLTLTELRAAVNDETDKAFKFTIRILDFVEKGSQGLSFMSRMHFAKMAVLPNPFVYPAVPVKLNSPNELLAALGDVVKAGNRGLYVMYEDEPNRRFMHHPCEVSKFTVLDIAKDSRSFRGENALAGTLLCTDGANKFSVANPLPAKKRQQMWADRVDLIGQQVSVRYIITDNETPYCATLHVN